MFAEDEPTRPETEKRTTVERLVPSRDAMLALYL